MPPCCSCGNRGRCQNCSCVTNGRPYSNCQPYMLRRCENQEKHLRNSHTSEVPPHKEQDPRCAPWVNRLEDYGLPPFVLLSEPKFRWSDSVDGEQFAHSIRLAYKEIAHWRNSIFVDPHGIVGKSFVAELSRLL